jgi:hypothetical protein
MILERRTVLITQQEQRQSAESIATLVQARGIDLTQPYRVVPDIYGNAVYVQLLAVEGAVPDDVAQRLRLARPLPERFRHWQQQPDDEVLDYRPQEGLGLWQ